MPLAHGICSRSGKGRDRVTVIFLADAHRSHISCFRRRRYHGNNDPSARSISIVRECTIVPALSNASVSDGRRFYVQGDATIFIFPYRRSVRK